MSLVGNGISRRSPTLKEGQKRCRSVQHRMKHCWIGHGGAEPMLRSERIAGKKTIYQVHPASCICHKAVEKCMHTRLHLNCVAADA
jgi:hypothetical protein